MWAVYRCGGLSVAVLAGGLAEARYYAGNPLWVRVGAWTGLLDALQVA